MSQLNGQSVQSDILDAAVAVLGAAASRSRFKPYARHELPAENVLPSDAESDYQDSDSIERFFRFDVRYQVAAVDGAEKVGDARYVRGTKLLMADPTLGGLCRYIRERKAKWEQEQGEVQILALVVTYEAEFSTTRTDPSRPGY